MTQGFNQSEWLTPNTYDDNYAPIPSKPGVYMFVKRKIDMLEHTVEFTVLYVGMTGNLARRCEGHEVKSVLDDRYDDVVTFFRVAKEGLRLIEKCLIQKFNPSYNLIHRVKGI